MTRRSVDAADIDRWRVVDLALQAEHGRLVADAGGRVSPAAPTYVHCYTKAALAADDQHGTANGWVTRHDLVRWYDLVVIARAAMTQLDPEHSGQHMTGCPGCDLQRGLGRLRESAQDAGIRPATPEESQP
jgi:hypothetical protein